MDSSPARRLFLFALALLAAATGATDAWDGGPMFFFSKGSKAARPEAVELDKVAEAPAADDSTNSVPVFSRPSSGGGSSRGYGLYSRPEESYPESYFRRGVHHNAERLTTTNAGAVTAERQEDEEAAPAGETAATGATSSSFPQDGSGMGRPMSYARMRAGEGTAGGATPSFPEDGSGRGRPTLYTGMRGGKPQRQYYYGMSDTRLYQNGRYYYDVDTGEYGYGHDSNPARTTRPEVFGGRRYGNAAGQEYTNANDDQEEFGSGGYNAGERAGTERYGNAAAGYHVKVNDQFAGNNGLENQNELYTP